MGDGRRDDGVFLGLVEGEELAGGAEDEDAVDAAGELPVDVPPQSVQVESAVIGVTTGGIMPRSFMG
jgi:hypothetical protein